MDTVYIMHNKKASRSGISDNDVVRALIREIVKAELAADGHTSDGASKLSDGKALYEIDLDREIDQMFSGFMNKFGIKIPGDDLRKLIDKAGDILKQIERERSGGQSRTGSRNDHDAEDQTELVRRSIEELERTRRPVTPENIAGVMTKLARKPT